MKISLSPKLEAFILSMINTGRYQSPVDVIADALHLLDKQDSIRLEKLRALRQAIAEGDKSLRTDPPLPFDAEKIKREGRKLLSRN
jgi:putative addiction module CopG family antidote